MKVLIQRVKEASVKVENNCISQISKGILAFVGIENGDSAVTIEKMAKKVCNLRIFPDENGKMNYSLLDVKGEMLVVSQFTLCGDCKKGTRPSFDNSAPRQTANELYELFTNVVRHTGINTSTGCFGAMMQVSLVNDGPVTFMLEM